MSRINTNVSSLIAQRVLQQNNSSLQTSLQRLSTGLKINTGADDPAGLIASETLKAEQTGINQAVDNANQATNMIGTAEGGLNEVSSLLNQLDGLVNQSANSGALSPDEVNANQLQVDSILNTINRISGTTSFQGTQLLNGNLDYTTSSTATSAFTSLQVNSANLPNNSTTAVVVQVTNSATQGSLTFTGTNVGSSDYAGASAITLEVSGSKGSEQLSFAGSATLSSIKTAIKNISSVTGVTASINGAALQFNSSDYGSKNFVSVKNVSGTFDVTGGTGGKAFGTDATVLVNGAKAQSNGLDITYRTSSLDVDFTLSTTLNNGKSKTFGITGGGASFALGEQVTENNKASIGIQSVSTANLGNSSLGFLNTLGSGGTNDLSSSSLTNAQSIVTNAISQVASLRGRLGAFQKFTLGSTINSLNVAYENISSSESAIADTDFAQETANLTRAQILQQSATTVLSQANAMPESALKLLG
jgi:flagellin